MGLYSQFLSMARGLYSVRIEDPVGRGGSFIRSLNVAFDTGLVLLLSLKDLL